MRCGDSGAAQGSKPGKRVRSVSGALIAGLLLASLAACSDEPRCGPKFEEGERFRFTVLGRVESDPNECVPLHEGDEFVLTAGMKQIDTQVCDYRPALPSGSSGIPQWEGIVDGCGEGFANLSVNCHLNSGPLGPLKVWFTTSPSIQADTTILEDGRLRVSWSKPAEEVECVEIFAVRIEALDRAPSQ